ncbi:MAG: hypothetical protein RL208_520 [Pseudomonadota bacterium]|jgi:type IV secretion system protein VirB8
MSILDSFKKSVNQNDWQEDKYIAVAIQRNLLLLFSIFTSITLLICIVAMKKMQESKSVDPYIIEYDKNTGKVAFVENSTKRSYTAQDAVRESLVTNYVSNREGLRLSNVEEIMNYIRVTTTQKLYEDYSKLVAQDISTLRSAGRLTKFRVDFLSISYPTANRAELKINKVLVADGKDVSMRRFNISINFSFVEIEMTNEDIRTNPLGFQVSSYRVLEEKILENIDLSSQQDSQNSSQNVNNTMTN